MKKQPTNDIILRILTNTYLFQINEIDYLLTEVFFRYLNLLGYINQQIDLTHFDKRDCQLKLETARSILYFIGYFYCEHFGRGAIERRLDAYDIDYLRFYEIVDRNGIFDLSHLSVSQANNFNKVVCYYQMLKRWKNTTVPGFKLYFAEDYYNDTRKRLHKTIDKYR